MMRSTERKWRTTRRFRLLITSFHIPQPLTGGRCMNDLVCELDTQASRITLGDFLVFIDWMNQAGTALDKGESGLERPDTDSQKVGAWVGLIQKLDERVRRIEEKRVALEANLMAQEAQLSQLLAQLHQNI